MNLLYRKKGIKNKTFFLFFLFLIICSSTSFAAKVGHTNQQCYVYAQPSLSAKRHLVAKNTKLYYLSSIKDFFKVKIATNGVNAYILKRYVKTQSSSWKNKVQKLTWNQGKNVLSIGSYATLYSIDTGIELKIKRMGGLNHMDVEPATAEDTLKLKKIAGGAFSWTCKAMILKSNEKYIACSINTMPHGEQTILDNDYNGQFCLHLLNSKTHGTNIINPEHQKQIERAYKWTHK